MLWRQTVEANEEREDDLQTNESVFISKNPLALPNHR
jgi:hypothetical protein